MVRVSVSLSIVGVIRGELNNFLVWLESYCRDKQAISLETHHNLPVDILNYYINYELIRRRSKSLAMADRALMSLRAYYNFLTYNGFTDRKDLVIDGDSKSIARENSRPRGVVKYYSPGLRSQIYASSSSLRDECILRAGGTTGVRAKENIGFLLNDFTVGHKKYHGLLSLFQKLKLNPDQTEFEYWLQGKYTKASRGSGGKSRMLYIPRDTLLRFIEYYEKERPHCEIDNLFVTDPSSGYLKQISPASASAAFANSRKKILSKQREGLLPDYLDLLDEKHSYHILRHSFGTDHFYDAVKKNGMRVDDVTPTSQPYLVVAALLGHSASGRGAPAATKEYIRSCNLKEKLEAGV
ncbi:hypothetical protein [Shewanella sp.]|uniref:hypothetical protein n=1 Tax=Shewanella sp. TaxID=50422 RepID=UPI004054226E